LASIVAGWLWDAYGAPVTFLTGAAFAGIAFIGFVSLQKFFNVTSAER
jgi:hypothetical protein